MKKQYFLLISIFFTAIGLLLSNTYRPYIYENNINDFHFADTIGNWVAVPAYVALVLGISRNKPNFNILLFASILAYILYEVLSILGLWGTFDWYDVLVTIISGILTYFGFKKLYDKAVY